MNRCVRWLAIFVVWVGYAWAGEPADDLAKIEHFAFGGVGIAGTTSSGEVAFRKLMAAPAPRKSFLRLLETGNLQAKCYALVGLKQVDPPTFEAKAASLGESKEIVQIIGGCIFMKEPLGTVIAHIRKGEYDQMAQFPKAKPPQ